MNTKELRIGNYIKSGTGFYKVVALSTDGIEATTKINDNILYMGTNTIYSGIELTKQWLIDFGFIRFGSNEDENDIYCIRNHDEVWIIDTGNSFILDEFEFKIKFVHQLQNLYFALTNEELIKPQTF